MDAGEFSPFVLDDQMKVRTLCLHMCLLLHFMAQTSLTCRCKHKTIRVLNCPQFAHIMCKNNTSGKSTFSNGQPAQTAHSLYLAQRIRMAGAECLIPLSPAHRLHGKTTQKKSKKKLQGWVNLPRAQRAPPKHQLAQVEAVMDVLIMLDACH